MNSLNVAQQRRKISFSVFGLLLMVVIIFVLIIMTIRFQEAEVNERDALINDYHLAVSKNSLELLSVIEKTQFWFLEREFEREFERLNRITDKKNLTQSPINIKFSEKDKIEALKYQMGRLIKEISKTQEKFKHLEYKIITSLMEKVHKKTLNELNKMMLEDSFGREQLDATLSPLIIIIDQLQHLHHHAYQVSRQIFDDFQKKNQLQIITLVVILAIIGLLGVMWMLRHVRLLLDGLSTTEKELEKHQEHLEDLVQERTASMKEARDEAERANAAKSEFLSRMSHELRTPLNAILGFAQLLEIDADELTKDQFDNVNEISSAGHHLLSLINEVLDLSAIESGKVDVVMENVPLSALLQECISLIRTQADNRQLEIIDHLSNKDYSVEADFNRLKQILLNLLSNATKYNCESGKITLDCEIIDDRRLRINVIDTGEGLSAQKIKKLFVPFERLDTNYNVEGAGIGLIISKYLIELMGGNIGVESTEGKGSTFWVELALVNY